jgi:hypothetical protein
MAEVVGAGGAGWAVGPLPAGVCPYHASMSRSRRITESVHIAALGVWLGALLLAGTAAAMTFPVLKDLNPSLPRFARYDGPHWLLAGGHVVQRVFLALDLAQFVCVVVAGATLTLALVRQGLSLRRGTTFVRIALLLALVAILSYRLGFLEPRMQGTLREYWAAAEAGNNAAAAGLKEAFDQGHPVERTLLTVTAGLVLASIIAAVWSVAGGEHADRAAERPAAGAELEVPLLARKRS